MKTASVKLTSAIGIQGQLIRRGEIITIGEDAAKDLLRRGKAVLATEYDEPEQDEDESAGDPPEPEPGAPAKTGKKK